jgi:hypothetical protein
MLNNMFWGNWLNPLGVAYHIYIYTKGTFTIHTYRYIYAQLYSLTLSLNLSHFLKNREG